MKKDTFDRRRDTSHEAYTGLLGRLGADQRRVLLGLREAREPLTDRELAARLGVTDPNQVRPRRVELMRRGLVEDAGKRRCRVTGRTAYVWQYVHRRIQRELW